MTILVTGAAGFIGYHLCKRLLYEGFQIVGFDNINNYYDTKLKKNRIRDLENNYPNHKGRFHFIKGDLIDKKVLKDLFNPKKHNYSKLEVVIHLAAQAGVRYSIENPDAYISSNLIGFSNLIEECKINKIKHFIYASSSSVYGGNKKLPFKETDNVDNPISLYAATKKSNELVAHTYSHLFNLPTTGLRFFTVYGPWGRPDMALFKFTELISNNKPIRVFNYGKMVRDFTYIDDVIEVMFRLIRKYSKLTKTELEKKGFYKIFNVGNSHPINLIDYINSIEDHLGKKAEIILEEIQPGDVEETFADTNALEEFINYKPRTKTSDGIKKFVDWYLSYYVK